MGLCRLCLNHSDQFIEIFSEHGRSLNVASVLAEYFWFEIIENDLISTTICQKCWCSTTDFQLFHQSIRLAQEQFFKSPNYLQYDGTEEDSKAFGAELIHNSSGASVDDPTFSVLEAELAKDVELHINDKGEDDLECKNEENTKLSDDLDVHASDYSGGSDIEETERLNSPPNLNNRKSSKRKSTEKVSKRPSRRRTKRNSSSSENEELSDEDEDEEDDEYNEQENGDDEDYDAGEEEYDQRSSSKRNTYSRSRNAKRTEEDTRIRLNCKLFCTICSSDFQTFNDLVRHYQTEHDIKGYVTCCDRQFKTRSRLLEHIDCHNNPNAFQCEICHYNFSGRFPLKKHMDTHMSDEDKPFICDKCPNRYTKSILLARHIFESHSTEEDKKFHCELCDKKYLTKSKLSDHVKRSHNCVPEICDFCGKEFKTLSNLNVHRADVHLTIEAPKLQCAVCGAWIKEKYHKKHLKRHMATVETCTVCGKVLQNKNSLGNHMRNVHGNRMHQCAVCGKTFSKPLSLREHMALHTGRDLYTCPYCPKTFKSGANMHSHRKKYHYEDWAKDRGKRLVTGNYT